jgi:uncharacterized protein DUF4153
MAGPGGPRPAGRTTRASSSEEWLLRQGRQLLGLRGPLDRVWPEPEPPRMRLLLAAPAVGVLAALLIPDSEVGVNFTVVVLAVTAAVLLTTRSTATAAARGGEQARRRGAGRVAVVLTGIAVALGLVATVRASEWLVLGCLAASACLGGAVALGAKRWNALLATVPFIGLAALRALPWGRRTLRRQGGVDVPVPALTGLVIGLVSAGVVGALLASADATFAALVEDAAGWFRVDLLVARVVTVVVFTLGVLGLGFAASTRLGAQAVTDRPARHPAEWMTPLVLVAAMIAAFLAVEATRLFGGSGTVLGENSLTHASRAREGFGQLIVVTVIVLALIGWAGRSAAGGHRALLGTAGGTLLGLTLLLSFSALRRLWLYQDEYGWTVTRLNAGAFELWVVALLIGVGVAWLIRRTDLVPRAAVGTAGLGLLVVALAGPDAIVAAADVHRFEQGGDIDTHYLSRLSADAVPALMDLPEPVRSCALPRPDTDAPWYAWNLSRERAERLLPTADPANSGCGGRLTAGR